MKLICTIFDSVAEIYSPTFQAENKDHAIRMFESSIDLRHKTDFTLWETGTYNQDSGLITGYPDLVLLTHGKNLSTKETDQ